MDLRRLGTSRLVFRPADFRFPGVIMFGRDHHATSLSALAPHVHPGEIEICFLERGEQTFRVKGRAHRLRGNDQFFTLPDELHDTANLPIERGILHWMILKLTVPRFLGLAEPQAAWLKRELCRMPVRHFRGHPDCARLLVEMIELLFEERKDPKRSDPGRQLRLQAALLRYLTLTMEASRRGAHGSASPLVQRVLRFIEGHLGDPIEVPRLAQVARLSQSRFKIRFKAEIGVPPAEYWLRKKIEKAEQLLKTRRVTEVAHELGFSSSQYFATAFKRYTLINPSQLANRRTCGRQ